MDDSLERVNCAICGKDETDVFMRSEGPVQIVKCRNDGFLFSNPRPGAGALDKRFSEYVPNLDMFTAFRREVLRREAKVVGQMKSRGNLLDIGCSVGTFFEGFDREHWQLYGVEPSVFNAGEARRRHSAEVFCGTLRQAKYPARFFDVITMLDTIYYIPDLRGELNEIYRCLKDDGFLMIEIQGLNYWLIRDKGPLCWLLDRSWSRVRGNRLYYFSPATLGRLLEATGFRVIRMFPEQGVLGRKGIGRRTNDLHYALARLLSRVTAGRVSVAAREVYLATKDKAAAVV